MKKWQAKIVGSFVGLVLASSASAALYQIQVTGLNLVYEQATGNICDVNGCAFVTGGTNNPASADPVTTMVFLKDNATVLTLTNPSSALSVDYALSIADGTAPGGGPYSLDAPPNGVGVVDFLVSGLPGIATNITNGTVTWFNGSLNMFGGGFSTVFSQNLPNNPAALGADWVGFNPINWSFSSGLGSCAAGICNYSGTGELSWSVPEPSSLLLAGLALVAAGSIRRKRA